MIRRKWSADFRAPSNDKDRRWYDLREDWPLIEASFAEQYGIRLRREPGMTYGEFAALLSGLLPDTPLGHVVAIRSEQNPERIRQFTPAQRRIYDEWAGRGLRMAEPAAYDEAMRQMEQFFLALSGGGKHGG